VKYFEPHVASALEKQTDKLKIPEAILLMFNSFVIIDHERKTVKAIALSVCNSADNTESYQAAVARIEDMTAKISERAVPNDFFDTDGTTHPGISNAGDTGYHSYVTSLRENIVAGDIIQAVPSQRVERKIGVHPWSIFRELRAINPSRYGFFIELEDELYILGSSPELLAKVMDGLVTNHPIAGTRRRGANEEEDAALAKELLDDEKERAEHIMLVDLGRNDVNRTTVAESTTVQTLMKIEMFSHVMHIVSCVTGKLRPECTPLDAFRSIFPAGTVSGAPKLKAIELVSNLEKEKRGVYAGAIGYFSLCGNIDTCIALRTMVVKDRVAYLQAGGGIVYDSKEEDEYQETINKMASLRTAIDKAEQNFVPRKSEGDAPKSESAPRAAIAKLNGLFTEATKGKITGSDPLPLQRPQKSIDNVIKGKTTLLIDNYDSFTWNLYQYLTTLGENVLVHRNDKITVDECLALNPDRLVVSPGPCDPSSAGISKDVILAFMGKKPILGVCLGHECMVEALGGKIVYAGEIMHGKTSVLHHDSKGIYEGIEKPFSVIRYHSLAAEVEGLPAELELVSKTESGVIMGVRHKVHRMEGVQYHPESIKTENGYKMIQNFLSWETPNW